MRRNSLLFGVLIFVSVCAGACTKDETDSSNKKNVVTSEQKSGAEASNNGLIEFIKKQKLVNYPSSTIGNAFDSYKYLLKKEWKLEAQNNGKFTVEFIGLLEPKTLNDNEGKDLVTSKGIIVTFVVEPNGSFYVFMVSTFESHSNGNVSRSQVKDIAGVLADIYANRKINV